MFLGLAYTSLGAHTRAEAAYHRAIALRSTNPHAYNYLGLTYHQQQRYREALAAYRQAIAQVPDYAVAYVNLAASHEALGQTAQALTAYRQALQYDAKLQAVQAKIDALSKQWGSREDNSPFAQSTSHILNCKLPVELSTQPQPLQDSFLPS